MGYSLSVDPQRLNLSNGKNWYVNTTTGADTNTGFEPDQAFKTVAVAVTAAAAGDIINISAGTYAENVLLNKNELEVRCDVGVTFSGGDDTCLSITANDCDVSGELILIPAADKIGLLIGGDGNAVCARVKVRGTNLPTTGVSVTGARNSLCNIRSTSPKATGKCFNIEGSSTNLENCVARGTGLATYGFWFKDGITVGLNRGCISSQNATSGFYLEDTVTGVMFDRCVSGAGDGPRKQGLATNTWSNWAFQSIVTATATITTSSGAQVLDLFDVTGSVMVKQITGHVEYAITAGVTAVQLVLQDTGTTVQITKNDGVLSSMPVGTLLAKTGDDSKTLEIESAASCFIMDEVDSKKESFRAGQMTGDVLTQIQMLLTAADDAQEGIIHWHIEYEQITEGSHIAVA